MTDVFRDELEAALGGAYAIGQELTGGGMSHVFVATERALGRKVVIKVLPPDFAAGVNRDRFQREIQLAARLQHPHIVPLLSAGEHGRLLWYTMPYIEGESLRTQIDRRGRLPVREVLRLISDVAEALAFAHGQGVIHRDIKPGNVLVQQGHALVTDFGVAKALSAALPSGAGTSTGMAIGTPSYMAPEQLASDPAADHRVDLYALGLLAYELLTGASPFEGPSPRETMAAQLTRIPPPLDAANPEVSPQLARIVSSCLQKDPARRPASAEDIVRQLEELSSGTVTARRQPRPALRWLGLAAAGAAAAALLLLRSDEQPSVVSVDTASQQSRDTVVVREPVAVPLSREDSLAIARAVESGSGGESLNRTQVESLRVQLERAMAESLSRAMAQLQQQPTRPPAEMTITRVPGVPPAPEAPRAVFVTPTTPDVLPPAGPARAIVYPVSVRGQPVDSTLLASLVPARDSLMQVVRGAELPVVSVDSLGHLMRQSGSHLAVTLRNSVQVIGRFEVRGDSLVLRVDLRPPGWPVRGRVLQLWSPAVPRDRPLAAVEAVGDKLAALLKRAAPQ
jgi:serine/threonine protein kinase